MPLERLPRSPSPLASSTTTASGEHSSRHVPIEPTVACPTIAPLHCTERHGRSSCISFERHSAFVLERLDSLMDDDDDDDDSHDDDGGSLDVIPSQARTEDELPEGEEMSLHRSIHIEDIAPSASSSNLQSVASTSLLGGSSSTSVLSQIEDEIIEDAVRAGKLTAVTVDESPEDDDNVKVGPAPQEEHEGENFERGEEEGVIRRTGHRSLESFLESSSQQSLASWRGSFFPGRLHSSFASPAKLRRRRFAFARLPPSVAEPTSK